MPGLVYGSQPQSGIPITPTPPSQMYGQPAMGGAGISPEKAKKVKLIAAAAITGGWDKEYTTKLILQEMLTEDEEAKGLDPMDYIGISSDLEALKTTNPERAAQVEARLGAQYPQYFGAPASAPTDMATGLAQTATQNRLAALKALTNPSQQEIAEYNYLSGGGNTTLPDLAFNPNDNRYGQYEQYGATNLIGDVLSSIGNMDGSKLNTPIAQSYISRVGQPNNVNLWDAPLMGIPSITEKIKQLLKPEYRPY